jgi:hypothetical protein
VNVNRYEFVEGNESVGSKWFERWKSSWTRFPKP